MDTATRKEVLTTGEVARICHVAPRTVSKWFDTGKLRGYRIPGSRDRRIPVDQLIAFMRAHSMPLDGLEGGPSRVLIIDPHVPGEFADALADSGRYDVQTAHGGFDGGVVAQRIHPRVIIIDASLDEAADICRNVKQHPELQAARVLAAVAQADEATRSKMAAAGFDGSVQKPYSLREFVQAVEDATNIIG